MTPPYGLFRPTHEVRVEGRRMPVMEINGDFYTLSEWLHGMAPSWRMKDGQLTFLGRPPRGFEYSMRELGRALP